jgi:hypothetical protein
MPLNFEQKTDCHSFAAEPSAFPPNSDSRNLQSPGGRSFPGHAFAIAIRPNNLGTCGFGTEQKLQPTGRIVFALTKRGLGANQTRARLEDAKHVETPRSKSANDGKIRRSTSATLSISLINVSNHKRDQDALSGKDHDDDRPATRHLHRRWIRHQTV